MKDEKEHTQQEKSAFNAAIAQLVRIHHIKQNIIEARLKGDVRGWVTNIFCMREELNPLMSKDEIKKADEFELLLANVEAASVGRARSSVELTEVISFQRFIYGIEERLGLAHISKEDDWATDDEDW
jgi:hypothetical protein